MNKNMIIVAVLAVLVVISAVQAFQLNDLKQKIAAGTVLKTGTPAAAASAGSGPSDINQLPSMVGGC